MAILPISRRRLALPALAAATLMPFPARAQDTPDVLRLVSDGGPTSPYGVGARAFAAELERRAGGRIRVELVLGVAAAGQALGPQRAQGCGLIEAVRAGDADLAVVSAAALGGLAPELLVLDLPFLFADAGSARAALDGPIGQELLAALAPWGVIGLGWGENGMRHVTTTARPVSEPGDLAGLAIRVQENELHRDAFAALGARPVSMPVLAEAVAALRDGRLDGQENALWVMSNLRLQDVQHHLSLTAHLYQSIAFLMSPPAYGRLADADREALGHATAAGIVANRAAVDAADAAALAQLQAAGMQVEPDPDRAAFLAAVQPVYARWRERLGAGRIERLRMNQ